MINPNAITEKNKSNAEFSQENEKLLDKNELLLSAASDGDLKSIMDLIENKSADVNYRDKNGYTAIMQVARSFIISDKVKIIEYLIKKGANVKYENNFGETVLLLLLERENYTACDYLISKGKNLESSMCPFISLNGKCTLYSLFISCSRSMKSMEKTVEYLLSRGVIINKRYDNDLYTVEKISQDMLKQNDNFIIHEKYYSKEIRELEERRLRDFTKAYGLIYAANRLMDMSCKTTLDVTDPKMLEYYCKALNNRFELLCGRSRTGETVIDMALANNHYQILAYIMEMDKSASAGLYKIIQERLAKSTEPVYQASDEDDLWMDRLPKNMKYSNIQEKALNFKNAKQPPKLMMKDVDRSLIQRCKID